jgi:hypothetical protein
MCVFIDGNKFNIFSSPFTGDDSGPKYFNSTATGKAGRIK